jgi:hypothetical protein
MWAAIDYSAKTGARTRRQDPSPRTPARTPRMQYPRGLVNDLCRFSLAEMLDFFEHFIRPPNQPDTEILPEESCFSGDRRSVI